MKRAFALSNSSQLQPSYFNSFTVFCEFTFFQIKKLPQHNEKEAHKNKTSTTVLIYYGVPFEKESTFFIRFAMFKPRLEDYSPKDGIFI